MQEFTDRQIEIMEAATNRISKYGIRIWPSKHWWGYRFVELPLYRHFKAKNEILLSLLNILKEMKNRIQSISFKPTDTSADELKGNF